MENTVKLSILLEIYGKLLTEKQYSLLEDYYNNDLSLSEKRATKFNSVNKFFL